MGIDVDEFKANGFTRIPRFYGRDEAARLRDAVERLAAGEERPGSVWMYFEESRTQPGKRILSRIENFVPFDDALRAELCEGPLMEAVSVLFGEPAVLFKDKVNFKRPGADGFKVHQDAQAGWERYGTLHISAMIALDPMNEGNGCVEIVAGRHREGLIGPEWAPLPEDMPFGFIPLVCEPGDAVFFDSYAPHRSAPNDSAHSRVALYVTYGRASEGDQRARYYADKHASYPPDCEREAGRLYAYRV